MINFQIRKVSREMNSPASSIFHDRCRSEMCPENCVKGQWKVYRGTGQFDWIVDKALTFECGNKK